MRRQREFQKWKKTQKEKEENSGKRSLETSPIIETELKTSKKKKANERKKDPEGSGESATDTASNEKENNSCKAHELLAEAKSYAKLVKSKIFKRDSKDAFEAVDNLFSMIAGLTTQLAFVKGKLTAYEKVKGAPQENKQANTYGTIAQRIVGTKEIKRMDIGQKPLFVTIKPKNKEKFKTMEEAKASLQKAFCLSWTRSESKRPLRERKISLWRRIQWKLCKSFEIQWKSADTLRYRKLIERSP